mmetsp:Transcript_14250/g.33730  ORF Transcript_14250/g.33730 Transcript_14250/m.33730 type:complete len:363 (+) Transcript_14250:324-1412(+)
MVLELDGETDTLLLGVLDGHGEHGDRCAAWLSREFPMRVFAHPRWGEDPLEAMEDVGRSCARTLADPAKAAALFIDTEFSGTTLSCVAVRGGEVFSYHVGDGAACLLSRRPGDDLPVDFKPPVWPARNKWAPRDDGGLVASRLTPSHRPCESRERARLEAAGARVFAIQYNDACVDPERAPERLWLPTLDVPGLALSRSFGDAIATAFAGLTAHPELRCVRLDTSQPSEDPFHGDDAHAAVAQLFDADGNPVLGLGRGGAKRGDSVLVLASDGLWATVPPQDAADLCERVLREATARNRGLHGLLGAGPSGTRGGTGGGGLAHEMCDTLVQEAQRRMLHGPTSDGRSDDTTAIVALLGSYGR